MTGLDGLRRRVERLETRHELACQACAHMPDGVFRLVSPEGRLLTDPELGHCPRCGRRQRRVTVAMFDFGEAA